MSTGNQNKATMESPLINCDLGENEPHALTQEAMALIDAANIGCGVHAGNVEKTLRTIELALQEGCLIGAHPGLKAEGGRGADLPSAADFKTLLLGQMDVFQGILEALGGQLAYIKLHGSLYHGVESHPDLAEVFIDYMRVWSKSGVGLVARAKSEFAEDARAEGIHVMEELFADRGYEPDGRLVARSMPGALLDIEAVTDRFEGWVKDNELTCVDGSRLRVHADTICVHADTKDSLEMIRSVRGLLNLR